MKIFLLAFITLGLIGLNFVNLTKADDSIRKELEAVYAKIDTAIKAKDVKTLGSLLAEDYEKNIGDQKIDREQAIAQMKHSFELVKSFESVKTTIDKIQQVEGNQIVDYTQRGKMIAINSEGKEETIEASSKGRDWWVKGEDGKWICVASERPE